MYLKPVVNVNNSSFCSEIIGYTVLFVAKIVLLGDFKNSLGWGVLVCSVPKNTALRNGTSIVN